MSRPSPSSSSRQTDGEQPGTGPDGLIATSADLLATPGRRLAAGLVIALFLVMTAGTGVVDLAAPLPYPKLLGAEKRSDAAMRAHAQFADGSLAKLVEHDLRVRSRVKKALTPPYTLALMRWLGVAPSDVVVGRDGWLFSASCRVAAKRTDEELTGLSASLFAALERRLAAMGIRTLFAPVPRKSVLYGSELPTGVEVRPALDRMFLDELERRGVPTVDLLTAFQRHEGEPLYYRADLHWTQTAELIAAEEICRAAGILAPVEGRTTHVRRAKRVRPEQTTTLETIGLTSDERTLAALAIPEGVYFTVFHGTGRFPERYENPATMPEVAIAGTSFTARRQLPRFLSHFSQQPVWNAARQGANPIGVVGTLLQGPGPLPRLIVIEMPMYQVFEGDYSMAVFDLFGEHPPTDAMTVLGTDQFERPTEVTGHSGKRTMLAWFRGGRLAHGADGVLALRVRGRTAGGLARLLVFGGTLQRTLEWQADCSEIVVPLVDHEPASQGLYLAGPDDFELQEIAVIAELSPSAAREARAGRVEATEGGWYQALSFPEEGGDEVPHGAVLLLDLDVEGAFDGPLHVLAGRGDDTIELASATLEREARWFVNAAPLRGRLGEIRVHGSGPPPASAVRRCRLLPAIRPE